MARSAFSWRGRQVYTIVQPDGNGYNTALLEAMLLGLAVVTIANPSSPTVRGVNGLIGDNLEELCQHLITLTKNPELRATLGQNAKRTVQSVFNEEGFLNSWRKALGNSLQQLG